jgi:hypothetical protein
MLYYIEKMLLMAEKCTKKRFFGALQQGGVFNEDF